MYRTTVNLWGDKPHRGPASNRHRVRVPAGTLVDLWRVYGRVGHPEATTIYLRTAAGIELCAFRHEIEAL